MFKQTKYKNIRNPMDKDVPDKFVIGVRKKFEPEMDIYLLDYNARLWKKTFGTTSKKIQITNIGQYSATNKHIADEIIQFIRTHPSVKRTKKKTITETNGGIGGLTQYLSREFHHIISVEILKEHYDVINNNLKVLKISNVQTINADYMDIALELKQDIIICDPPWGGRSYRKNKHLKLGFNGVNIAYVINQLHKEKKFKLFILLAPINFDLINFMRLIEIPDISIRHMGKHYLIGLSL